MAVRPQALALSHAPPRPDIGSALRRYYGWQIELDLRSLKRTMQMDVLRCKTPELVRKEIWGHVLAYNLVRRVMGQAAARTGVQQRAGRFEGAVQNGLGLQRGCGAYGESHQ